jgi:hypothetical protein
MPDLRLHKDDLKASLPPLLTALAYGVVLLGEGTLFGYTGQELRLLLQVEFLVIHSFPFLCIFAWMGGEGTRHPLTKGAGGKPIHWRMAFWGMLALYVLMALSMGGMGLVYFLVATAATYPVFLGFGRAVQTPRDLPRMTVPPVGPWPSLGPRDKEEWLRLGSSWIACFILYLSFLGFFDLPNNVDDWRAEPSTYKAGLAYFLSLALMELFGVHAKMARWVKVTAEKAKPPEGSQGPR